MIPGRNHLPTVLGWLLPLAAGLAACGSGGRASNYPPPREAVIPLDGQMLFPAKFDERAQTYFMAIDTGAVRSAVEESLLSDVVNGVGSVTIDFGENIVMSDFQVIAADLSAAVEHVGVPIHGLIGQDLFADYFFGLDYRKSQATMSEEIPLVPPPGFSEQDALEVPYSLEQLLPIVEVNIGGSSARLIADSGSGVTILTESFVSPDLLASGLRGYVWHTSYGSDPGTIVRLPAITLGGRVVEDSWAVVVPDDYHLKPVFDAIGVQVDGFLGYPVYRRFYFSVMGNQSRYVFYPYQDLSFLPKNEWDRVGIEIARTDNQVVVDMVFSPSAAETQGVLPGDVLLSIDGASLAGFSLDEIRMLLRAEPGDSRSLRLARGADEITVDVTVDRLLAPLR
jgi:hypothetical protein